MQSGYELGNIKQTAIQEILKDSRMRDLRAAMVLGEWHTACQLCRQAEETTGSSARTVRLVQPETLAAIERDPGNYFKLEHIVVNWSNLCNLTCVYCNADTSTAWQSIKGIAINHVKNEHPDLIRLAQEHGHTVHGLSLGGGEPLLQRGLLDFLRCLNPAQVRVMVTTNLSINITNNPIYNELRRWPQVDWMISFDNADPVRFEYVRDGANWDTFVDNIQLMKQHGQKVIAHPAYSIYCALDLVKYYEFCAAEDLDIFWCELTHPWDLDIRRYPQAVRQQAAAEIDRVLELYGNTYNLAVNTLRGYRCTLLDNSYLINPEFTPNAVEWHQQQERELNKNVRFTDIWPEYAVVC
jgi:MoaA/NifB/PqqE/SkfB family radical SAM enzyme